MHPAEQDVPVEKMKIHTVQAIRKIVLYIVAAIGVGIFAVTNSVAPSGSVTHEMIEWTGIVLIVICILGRTWSSLYIGGRKIEELVTVGPFSITRNPLYFFSVIGAAGVGCQLGSVLMGVICAALAYVIFLLVVKQEEQLLLDRFGDTYQAYLARVPRFLPKPWLWRDEPTLVLRPPRVLTTFGDALVFLLSVPIAELFEHFQDMGVIPVLLHLP